jgi:hypothetical protein
MRDPGQAAGPFLSGTRQLSFAAISLIPAGPLADAHGSEIGVTEAVRERLQITKRLETY